MVGFLCNMVITNKNKIMKNEELVPEVGVGSIEPAAIVLMAQTPEVKEMLKICANGDIFVKGKLVENNKEVVDALREFLKLPPKL